MRKSIIIPAPNDLIKLAKLRSEIFPNSFATKLGKKYLEKTFECYLNKKIFSIYAIMLDKKMVGYICIKVDTSDTNGLGNTSTLIKRTFWVGFFSIITKPMLAYNLLIRENIVKRLFIIFKSFMKRSKKNTSSNRVLKNSKTLWIVDIGTHPKFRKQGIGSELISLFDKEIEKKGFKIGALSVKKNNPNAIKFYENLGWAAQEEKSNILIMKKYYT